MTSGPPRPRVYLTPDNKVVKISRQKGLLTSNRLYPCARRFERNAKRLNALRFHSVAVEKAAKFRPWPISAGNRLGNFFNILRYAEDHASLTRHGLTRFFGDYLRCRQLGEKRKVALVRKLKNAPSFP